MFGLEKRRRRKLHQEITAQWSAIQRYVFDQLRPSFMAAHGQIPGGQLAQAVGDRIFARQVSLTGKERLLADQLAADLVRRNGTLREAAFASLRAMLEVEGANNNFPAERRILDTMEWLKQFGGLPAESVLSGAFARLRAGGVTDLDEPEEDSDPNESDSEDSARNDSGGYGSRPSKDSA